MGTKERRERERAELKQRILQAARTIAVQDGWQAVTVRRVADLIEYSPPAIYDYFASKDAILRELVGDGFGALLARMRAAREATGAPGERLVQLALSYCAFAWDQSEVYQVMHSMAGANGRLDDMSTLAEIHAILLDAFRNAAPAVAADEPRLRDAMEIHWATLHGIVSLTMQGHLPGGKEHAFALAERATRDWLVCAGAASRDLGLGTQHLTGGK